MWQRCIKWTRNTIPRFVVTSLSLEMWPPQKLYEALYCGRGDMENRIKEQLSLFADRVSSELRTSPIAGLVK
jgi:hypothetical protein